MAGSCAGLTDSYIVWLAGMTLLYGPMVIPGGSVIPKPPGTVGRAVLPGFTDIGFGAWPAGTAELYGPSTVPGGVMMPSGPPGTMVGVAMGCGFLGTALPPGIAFWAIAIPARGAVNNVSKISPKIMLLILINYHPHSKKMSHLFKISNYEARRATSFGMKCSG
jgi:hypothetical protein